MKELKEQLERCKNWLKEEPEDIEVIEKVKELEEKISVLEEENRKNNKKEKLEKEIEKKVNSIKELKGSIVRRGIMIKGMEDECMVLNNMSREMNNIFVEKINEEYKEYCKLVEELESI